MTSVTEGHFYMLQANGVASHAFYYNELNHQSYYACIILYTKTYCSKIMGRAYVCIS